MKRVLCILLGLLLIPAICISVFAHPGRTDSNGGHFDSSSDQYHYHHGQPAHDHYDMNGDNTIDCPYNFVNLADQSQNRSSEHFDSDMGGHVVFIWITVLAAVAILILLLRIRFYKRKLHEAELISAQLIDRKEEIISLLRSDMASLCTFTRRHVCLQSQDEFRFYYDIYGAADFDIPDDVYFINSYVPVKGTISENKPYGDFTVYIPSKGECYHSNRFCSKGFHRPVHIYDVTGCYRPCPKCAVSKLHTPPEWYDVIKRIMENSKQQ